MDILIKREIAKRMLSPSQVEGSGTLLARLYKHAGTPAIECSPTKF